MLLKQDHLEAGYLMTIFRYSPLEPILINIYAQ